MDILYILLVFIVALLLSYVMPYQVEEYANSLGLDFDNVNCIYKSMTKKEQKYFIYRGKKSFLFKIVFKNYKEDPHRTILNSCFFLNYYFYISFVLSVFIIIIYLFNIISPATCFFLMIFYFLMGLIIYGIFCFYYEKLADKINSVEILKLKDNNMFYYYLKNEDYDITQIHKKFSNNPIEAIKHLIIEFNYQTTLKDQIEYLDMLNYLIKYYDISIFQKQLHNKFLKLFDNNIEPNSYYNNLFKVKEILENKIFKTKKEQNELNYFINLITYNIGYEKEIYELEKVICNNIIQQQEFNIVYLNYKKLSELVKKQIAINEISLKLILKKSKYQTEDEYFTNLVSNLTYDNSKTKNKISKFIWFSLFIVSLCFLGLILLDFINLISVIVLILAFVVANFIYSLNEYAKNIPYYNLYVKIENEDLKKYNFLAKYI